MKHASNRVPNVVRGSHFPNCVIHFTYYGEKCKQSILYLLFLAYSFPFLFANKLRISIFFCCFLSQLYASRVKIFIGLKMVNWNAKKHTSLLFFHRILILLILICYADVQHNVYSKKQFGQLLNFLVTHVFDYRDKTIFKKLPHGFFIFQRKSMIFHK